MRENTFDPNKIEQKWQKKWLEDRTYTPNIKDAEKPYYNLMMFPYPSAEGLHVGNMYAFTGTDVYGRFKRMQGHNVFEPIGLDGFGIHSENYALKVGRHPKEQAKRAEENFYRQLQSIGNGFAWDHRLETYDPKYYKWTQWLFVQMFKQGLAYRKKSPVNWCPSCKTVLADEQVIAGECERCGSLVEKRDLEQWFFKITEFAEELLERTEGLDWSQIVKTAQINWIGKSEGARIRFRVEDNSNYVLLHGFTGSVESDFFPWLRSELKSSGNSVWAANLPDTDDPDIEKQVQYVLSNASVDENTILFGHSLGSVVALKVAERLKKPIKKLVLAAGFAEPGFLDHERGFEKKFDWKFDFEKIKKNIGEVVLLRAENDSAVPNERAAYIQKQIGGKIIDFTAERDHVTGESEPKLLKSLVSSIEVFTTRPDTLFGATFMVVAPEHELVKSIESKEVQEYVKKARKKTEIERTNEEKEKTGVFSGLYAINPINNEEIPIWVADYVLAGYGTGAIMAVPAHDQRDFEFAKKYSLPVKRVVSQNSDTGELNEAYSGVGKLVNSGEWDGWEMPKEMSKVLEWLEKKRIGSVETNFHLRDWLISRQRYWGPPIPMIYCPSCAEKGKSWFDTKEGSRTAPLFEPDTVDVSGWYPIEESKLPVLLPDVEDWRPEGTGKAPLANHPEFYETTCPECGGKATRETDVSDTFLDSAWYFLRYPSIDTEVAAFDTNIIKKWLPVDSYIGGAEHSVLHLLYARFITSFLYKLKLLDFNEPFTTFRAHGLIIKDGAKMSKSKGNVVVPDQYIAKYGADTLRTYLMFLGPLSGGGDFRDSGIEGIFRFTKRIWALYSSIKIVDEEEDREIEKLLHKTIKEVTNDINDLTYNTAIARLMEFYNAVSKREKISRSTAVSFIKLLAPFAPHITEELYEKISTEEESVHLSRWPSFDPKLIVDEKVTIVVQVNGKRRGEIVIDQGKITDKDLIEQKSSEIASKQIGDKTVKKVIYVPGKIINFVI